MTVTATPPWYVFMHYNELATFTLQNSKCSKCVWSCWVVKVNRSSCPAVTVRTLPCSSHRCIVLESDLFIYNCLYRVIGVIVWSWGSLQLQFRSQAAWWTLIYWTRDFLMIYIWNWCVCNTYVHLWWYVVCMIRKALKLQSNTAFIWLPTCPRRYANESEQ